MTYITFKRRIIMQNTIKYEDYKNMIFNLAHRFHKTTGIETKELISCGNLKFVTCQKTYDSSKASFSTYLTIQIRGMFLEMDRKHRANPEFNPTFTVEEYEEYGYGDYLERFADYKFLPKMLGFMSVDEIAADRYLILKEMLHNLSDDAKEVVDVVFNAPNELVNMIPDKFSHGITKNLIKRYLLTQGWCQAKIRTAFNEISDALAY